MGKRVQRHGLKGLMARVSTRGLVALDARSAGMQALRRWRQELEQDLGGAEGLSAQKRTIVELVCRQRLLLDHIDGWLMTQDQLMNKKRRSLYPILSQRNTLVNTLTYLLKELGLEKQPKYVGSLDQYLEGATNEHPANDGEREVVLEDVPDEEAIREG
ncbi:MAG TPA: hypothetical protein VOA88_10315 [Candidatus Dormibacteraeota bacterium]|nr:hypothetical protein [Candidatus Dormibacteraeota bacterium]